MGKKDFVSIDNIHQATDLIKIQNLMKNAERLGEESVVEKCKARILELSNKSTLEINYKYWAPKNSWFSDQPFTKNDSSFVGLKYAEKGGLIRREDYDTPNALVSDIEERIINCSVNNSSSEELLSIFDLIQGWGGKNGRSPYVKGKSGTLKQRMSDPEIFCQEYRTLVQKLLRCANKSSYEEAETRSLEKYKLDGMTINFTSKHYNFWSKYKNCRLIYYIFDSRMKNICKVLLNDKVSYYGYLNHLKYVEEKHRLEEGEAEKGLFAFSNYFFKNDKIILKTDIKIQPTDEKYKDFMIAKAIVS